MSFANTFHAEKLRQNSASPANLTRLSTRIMEVIHDWLMFLSFALIRFIPVSVFGLSKLSFNRIPLSGTYVLFHCLCRGPSQQFGRQFIFFSFSNFLFFLLQ
ncbi:hypothetical protein [Anditalea andensis]|uniref:hypothetical protein n=1 Tax=Anditalea andensis TaxID=1048983 RepID=UPI0013DE9191|nr:hypothetical protein [Anditalea andensis]